MGGFSITTTFIYAIGDRNIGVGVIYQADAASHPLVKPGYGPQSFSQLLRHPWEETDGPILRP